MIVSAPLSNGDMGDRWRAAWCDQCAHDHTAHIDEYDPDKTCQIFNRLLLDEMPIEELTVVHADLPWVPGSLRCSRFKACAECGEDDWS